MWLEDSFDYDTLWRLLAHIAESHRLVRFTDVAGAQEQESICILRHDVDYSTKAALSLAHAEASRGIRATYFLLVNSEYYNLLGPSDAGVPAAIAALGHEVGLHYDVGFFQRFPRERWDALLDIQAELLSDLCGQRVTSIAMHQPGLNEGDPFSKTTRYINAYADRFTKAIAYFSDSCRAWRDAAWQTLAHGPLPARLQLALHPVNWGATDRDRVDIFRRLHSDLAQAVLDEGDDLLTKIAVHQAVLEHNARTARS